MLTRKDATEIESISTISATKVHLRREKCGSYMVRGERVLQKDGEKMSNS